MKKNWIASIISLLVAFLVITSMPLAQSRDSLFFAANSVRRVPAFTLAQNSAKMTEKFTKNTDKDEKFPVLFNGEELFAFSVDIGGVSPKSRAAIASENIKEFAGDLTLSVEKLRTVNYENLEFIVVEDKLIVALVKADAKVENKELDVLAKEYLKTIKGAIVKYRESRRSMVLIRGALYALIATLMFFLSIKLINYLYPKIYRQIERQPTILFRPLRIQNFQLLSAEEEARIFLLGLKILRWLIILAILYIYIPAVLSGFPWTARFGKTAFNALFDALAFAWNSFLGYLPNLFIIAITIFIAYYTIRFCRPFFKALERGRITIPGFYNDWAEPTYKLVVILIIAIAATITVPYLPGFDSPAFQGISLLIGALVTLGGASAIANLIGGFIIIYTRAFQIGDRIKIGEFTGDVLDKTILSTRIRTPNNEIVTVPNSTMIASSIMNYSTALRDIKEPITLYTTITLGYDLPWRKVHETLIAAALATPEIISDPAPTVWQTSLDDFYISYQLRAYTKSPSKMGEIYSQLHQNIQDKCNEVGIEIMSPHYSALRDGNHSTVPENYLPKDYRAPGFGLHNIHRHGEGES